MKLALLLVAIGVASAVSPPVNTPVPDAGSTAGADAGTTAGADARTTAGADAGTTAGADAGTTAGADAGTTAGADAGTTAGADAGTTAGADAGTTAGGDAGTTAGADAGTAAGGEAGTTAGGDAGTTAGADAGTAAGADAGTTAGGEAGTTAGADAGTTAGADAGTTAGPDSGSSGAPAGASGAPDAGSSEAPGASGAPDAGSSEAPAASGAPDAGSSEAPAASGAPDAGSSEAPAASGAPDAGSSEAPAASGAPEAAGSTEASAASGAPEAAGSTAAPEAAGSTAAPEAAGSTDAAGTTAVAKADADDATCKACSNKCQGKMKCCHKVYVVFVDKSNIGDLPAVADSFEDNVAVYSVSVGNYVNKAALKAIGGKVVELGNATDLVGLVNNTVDKPCIKPCKPKGVLYITVDNSPFTSEGGFNRTKELLFEIFEKYEISNESLSIAVIYSACDDITKYYIDSKDEAMKVKQILSEKPYKPNTYPDPNLIFKAINEAMREFKVDYRHKTLLLMGGYKLPDRDKLYKQLKKKIMKVHTHKVTFYYAPVNRRNKEIDAWTESTNPKKVFTEVTVEKLGKLISCPHERQKDGSNHFTDLFGRPNEGKPEPTEPTVAPTEPTVGPTEPTVGPTEPTVKPEGSSEAATEGAASTEAGTTAGEASTEAGTTAGEASTEAETTGGASTEGASEAPASTEGEEANKRTTVTVDNATVAPGENLTLPPIPGKTPPPPPPPPPPPGGASTVAPPEGGASTEGVTEGASTEGATEGASTEGATEGASTEGATEGASTEGATEGASTEGATEGASTEGATAGASTEPAGSSEVPSEGASSEASTEGPQANLKTTALGENVTVATGENLTLPPLTGGSTEGASTEGASTEVEVSTTPEPSMETQTTTFESQASTTEDETETESATTAMPVSVTPPPEGGKGGAIVIIIDAAGGEKPFEESKKDAVLTITSLRKISGKVDIHVLIHTKKVIDIEIHGQSEFEAAISKVTSTSYEETKQETYSIFKYIKDLNTGDKTQIIPIGELPLPTDEKEKKELGTIVTSFNQHHFKFTFIIEGAKVPSVWKGMLTEVQLVPKAGVKDMYKRITGFIHKRVTLTKFVFPIPLSLVVTLDASSSQETFLAAKKLALVVVKKFVLGSKGTRLVLIVNNNNKVSVDVMDEDKQTLVYLEKIQAITYAQSKADGAAIVTSITKAVNEDSKGREKLIFILSAIGEAKGAKDLAALSKGEKIQFVTVETKATENLKKVFTDIKVYKSWNLLIIIKEMVLEKKAPSQSVQETFKLRIENGMISAIKGNCLDGSKKKDDKLCIITSVEKLHKQLTKMGAKIDIALLKKHMKFSEDKKLQVTFKAGKVSKVFGKCPDGSKPAGDQCEIDNAKVLFEYLISMGANVTMEELVTGMKVEKSDVLIKKGRISKVFGICLPGSEEAKSDKDFCRVMKVKLLVSKLKELGLSYTIRDFKTTESKGFVFKRGNGRVSRIGKDCPPGTKPQEKDDDWCTVEDVDVIHEYLVNKLGLKKITKEELKYNPLIGFKFKFKGKKMNKVNGKCLQGTKKIDGDDEWCQIVSVSILEKYLESKGVDMDVDKYISGGAAGKADASGSVTDQKVEQKEKEEDSKAQDKKTSGGASGSAEASASGGGASAGGASAGGASAGGASVGGASAGGASAGGASAGGASAGGASAGGASAGGASAGGASAGGASAGGASVGGASTGGAAGGASAGGAGAASGAKKEDKLTAGDTTEKDNLFI